MGCEASGRFEEVVLMLVDDDRDGESTATEHGQGQGTGFIDLLHDRQHAQHARQAALGLHDQFA